MACFVFEYLQYLRNVGRKQLDQVWFSVSCLFFLFYLFSDVFCVSAGKVCARTDTLPWHSKSLQQKKKLQLAL